MAEPLPVIDMKETQPDIWEEACGNVVEALDGPVMACPGVIRNGHCIHEQYHYSREA